MRRVILESPYAGNIARNTHYARCALRDCLARGEAPIASHLLYTQPGVLRDADPGDRNRGISAGLAWGQVAEATVVYIDYGITPGMSRGMEDARRVGRTVEMRRLFDSTPEFYPPSSPKNCNGCAHWERHPFVGPFKPEMGLPGTCWLDGMRTGYDETCGRHAEVRIARPRRTS